MELKFCHEQGIPHSIFLGRTWPNPENPSEPQWLEADYLKVMAYVDAMGELCDRCSTKEEDWVDERGFPLDVPILEVDTYRCPGCEQIEIRQKEIPSESNGIRPVVKRFDPNLYS